MNVMPKFAKDKLRLQRLFNTIDSYGIQKVEFVDVQCMLYIPNGYVHYMAL
jgi:hypothetical protein